MEDFSRGVTCFKSILLAAVLRIDWREKSRSKRASKEAVVGTQWRARGNRLGGMAGVVRSGQFLDIFPSVTSRTP